MWSDGTIEMVDTIILATGYQSNMDFLSTVLANQRPVHTHGVSLSIPGLYFVGLPGQRNTASATLRGAGPDSARVVQHLHPYLQNRQTLRPQHSFLNIGRIGIWPALCCAPTKA
jgi:putative flavoprotein involved in K+ transport